MNAKIKHKLACFIRNPTVNPECYKIACKNICTFYQIFIQKFGSRVKHNSLHNGRGDPTVENTTICSRVLAEIEPIAQTNPIKSLEKEICSVTGFISFQVWIEIFSVAKPDFLSSEKVNQLKIKFTVSIWQRSGGKATRLLTSCYSMLHWDTNHKTDVHKPTLERRFEQGDDIFGIINFLSPPERKTHDIPAYSREKST